MSRVLAFEHPPVRRWEVVHRGNDIWRGELFDGRQRVGLTEEGPFHSVKSTVEDFRRGLPMIVRKRNGRAA